MVGLVPLFSCLVLEEKKYGKLKAFTKRSIWFIDNRPDLSRRVRILAVFVIYLEVPRIYSPG